MKHGLGWVVLVLSATSGLAEEKTPAQRGEHILTQTAFIRGFWPQFAYDNVWKQWGIAEKPKNYDAAIRERYGLHPAPYPNGNLPMGLRKTPLLIGSGIGIDCMTCHGSSLFGKNIVGLGNASLDIHSLFMEFAAASGIKARAPYQFCQARGTSEAGAFSVHLLSMRNPDLSLAAKRTDLGLHDDSCEDVPAWWVLKKKKTMYHVGGADTRSVRSIMQFMMHPLTTRAEFDRAEPLFRDIRQYILSIEAPKYPFPIDQGQAAAGEKLFAANCARCHGTYGDSPKYPNKIIPLAEIGTDRKRYDNIGPKFGEAYNASWFAQEDTGDPARKGYPFVPTDGYQCPPLDGIWATAPYFHNGSVPTLAGVLDSQNRPKIFTRSYQTDEKDYDKTNVGWIVQEVPPPGPKVSGHERRKVYDTTQPGRGNAGHTYGDDLTPAERAAVIEYLKTL
ncbi:MAG: c-type cytochrome [Bacteroidales bacterium]|nr:c-type cytochrome [Bacteroidales bacterium]